MNNASVLHRGSDPTRMRDTLRPSAAPPEGTHETRTHRDTCLRRRRSWCHFPWMEICCALARFRNRFTTESKGLRAIKGYLFAPHSLSVHGCHMFLHRRGETERGSGRAHTHTDRQTDRHTLVNLCVSMRNWSTGREQRSYGGTHARPCLKQASSCCQLLPL